MNETVRFLQSCASDAEIDIVRLVDCVIIDAVRAGASDIHIEPWESSIAVRVRLSGVLNELVHLPSDLLPRVTGRLKVMANLIGHETQLPQEGRANTFPEAGNVVLRVSTFPTVRGEKTVIRILIQPIVPLISKLSEWRMTRFKPSKCFWCDRLVWS